MKEKDIQDFIYDSYENGILEQYGLALEGELYSEMDLKSYGRVDLISFDMSYEYIEVLDAFDTGIDVTVIEIKKDRLDVKALLQLSRYALGIRNGYYLLSEEEVVYLKDIQNLTFSYTLIGAHIDDDLATLLRLLPNFQVYLYEPYNDVFVFKKYNPHSPHLFLNNKVKINL